uniref:Neuropilin 2a n=1 Tax=Astyanax mexicanus TaxID=7994 RepID=A0A8B9KZH2_ASTMX
MPDMFLLNVEATCLIKLSLSFSLCLSISGEKCGGHLDASDAGYITSPGYPLEYPPHQNCEWVITAAEPTQRIVLNFNPHFELERLNCRYDFIEIRDGNSDSADLLGKHCSNIAPPAIISSGPVLHIKFVSDYAHQGAGFSLRYEIHKTGSEHCFRNFTAPTGVIESPDFPDKYPHNLECSYIIIAPPQTEVTLTFKTFDLENDPLLMAEGDCKYDWLDVWDGLPQVSPQIGRYCGTKIPPEIVSSTGLLSLTFHTDMAVAKDGFSAHYNMTRKEVSDTFHCSTAFGLESGKISDEQITASSSFYDGRWQPRLARLNNEDNAWTPSEDSNKEYIQVDLHFLKVLTGIATQGAISKETQKSYYVTTFKLEVSTNGEDWMIYRHGKNHKVRDANLNRPERRPRIVCLCLPTCEVTDIFSNLYAQDGVFLPQITDEEGGFSTFLDLLRCRSSRNHFLIFEGNSHYDTPELRRFEEIPAQFIRIYPERWSPAGIGMRMEVLGCSLPETSTIAAETSTSTLPPAAESSTAHKLSSGSSTSTPSPAVLCDFEQGFCGWTDDPDADLNWVLHSSSRSTALGQSQDLSIGSNSLGNYLFIEANLKTQGKKARLFSPEVGPDTGPLCLKFSYQLEDEGTLRVLLRNPLQEETLLWALHGNQEPIWKEGRTIIPRSPKEFQVVIEGVFEKATTGHIWIDNIHMSSSTPLEECTRKFKRMDPRGSRLLNSRDQIDAGLQVPEWSTAEPSSEPPVTRVPDKESSWLYTLDPILLTIIVMSSLGVLLGAVCAGLLLYCTCTYGGLTTRSSTTLENYNFELYDGIKHKVKLNQQRCCSEA